MANISVSRDLLVKTRDQLEKLAEEKSGALDKVAAYQAENTMLTDLMHLIDRGYISASDALTKLSSFRDDPTELLLYKRAHYQTMETPIGEPVDAPETDLDSATPEQKFSNRLNQIYGT